ncbi:MAG TPA: permease [Kineosporiaceae bacterium]|nr:permease [Kineosporiaceae bacterium]
METSTVLHGRRTSPGRSLIDVVLDKLLIVLSGSILLALIGGYAVLTGFFESFQVQTASTVFVAIVVQALPFLTLGTAVSGAISAFGSPAMLGRLLPAHPGLAVPAAGALGMVLPGCECASVPVARRLIVHGVAPAAALTFMLAAPAINPVVLVATAIAFPGRPVMVLARLVASMLTAVIVGWIWVRRGDDRVLARLAGGSPPGGHPRGWRQFVEEMRADLMQSGGFLVIGAGMASILNVAIPQSRLGFIAGVPVISVLILATVAVIIAVCSEADAFIASSLTQFSLTARLAFMVVGPAIDLKLFALQTGTFGGRFSTRFAPLTFLVAVIAAGVTGAVLL